MPTLAFAVLAILFGLQKPVEAQTLSPFTEFQGLTTEQLATLQGKITYVGAWTKQISPLVFAASGHVPDIAVFRPFYRAGVEYGCDDSPKPRTFTASTSELAAFIHSVAALPTVTDGGVDGAGGHSFALSIVKNGTTKVFESVLDTMSTRLLFSEMVPVFASNALATEEIAGYACGIGLRLGPLPKNVTSQVSIRVRGFRKNRSTGQYVGTVRVTNTGSQSIQPPIIFVSRPPENVTQTSREGRTCVIWPPGASYQTLPLTLARDPVSTWT